MKEDPLKSILQMVNHASIVAWEGVAASVLPPKSRKYILKESDPLLSFNHSTGIFEEFCNNYNYLSKKTPIIGWVTKSKEDIVKTEKLLKSVSDAIESKQGLQWSIAEILAKVLAYRELHKGMEIDIPMFYGKEKCSCLYTVDRRFNLWKQMTAFGLVPLEKGYPPILLFRGTDFSLLSNSSRISVISNFDPAGPGYSIYQHARPSIARWLDKVCGKSEQAISLGFSLGGSMAAFAMMKDPAYFSQTTPSYIFNHPGLCGQSYEKWQALTQNETPLMRAFVSDGDVVSKYGYLFDTTYGIVQEDSIAPIKAHTSLHFLQSGVKTKQVDLEKENSSESRSLYSKLHKNTASLFFNIGLKWLFPAK
ncbi:MAG: DUF2974 domain-containing protein [Rhabdochlamydiaceae bacterium]|nr:DUF2974 domain-containing protein [Candidatus Amphrikana amoebophyrae]